MGMPELSGGHPMAGLPFRRRVAKARRAMTRWGIDLLALFPGPNMAYLTGFREEPGERLLLTLIPREGDPLFIVPKLYEAHVATSTWVKDLRPWNDGEDPGPLLRGHLRELGAHRGTIAVDPRMWSRFLLMFQAAAPGARLRDAAQVMDGLRVVKDPDEIAIMERGFRATDRVMKAAIDSLRPGIREREVAATIASAFLEEGADMTSFDPIVGSGPNGALPHHRAGERRLRRGDAVVLDLGGQFQGYCTDISRTAFLGVTSASQERIYDLVKRAQEAAFRIVRPGVPAQRVDREARAVIAEAGYGDHFTHRTGHGIGLEVHEEPYIVEGNATPLRAAMCFSDEPGIYLPGEFGVRIEDIVVVEKGGGRRLSRFPRDPMVV